MLKVLNTETTELKEKRQDADELINEVLRGIPEGKKLEALRLLEGFSLCASNNQDKKVG